MPKNPVIIFAAIIASSVGLGLNQETDLGPKLLAASEPSDHARIHGQIARDFQKALKLHSEAETLEAWESSGYTPDELLQNVKVLASKPGSSQEEMTPIEMARHSRAVWNTVCDALKPLPITDLLLFEDVIEDTDARKGMSCAEELVRRLEEFRNAARTPTPEETSPSPTQHHTRRTHEVRIERYPVKTLEVHVETARGQILSWHHPNLLQEGQFAITLDDGPHPKYTAEILDVLKAAGIRATYFMAGRPARQFSWLDLPSRVVEEGHTLGSHSFSHPNLSKLWNRNMKHAKEEIISGRDSVAFEGGVKVPFFRFPYGASNAPLQQWISNSAGFGNSEGMATFFWDVDSEDWKYTTPEKVYSSVCKQLDRTQGGIMLMHDTHSWSVIALVQIIDELRRRNITPVVFIPH